MHVKQNAQGYGIISPLSSSGLPNKYLYEIGRDTKTL